jgi:protein O-mannosyl-transferase
MGRKRNKSHPRLQEGTARPAAPGQSPVESPWIRQRGGAVLSVILIVATAAATYANSFRGEFIFDDRESIPENRTIRDLGDLAQVFSPPRHGETVSGRPLLNLSFAINYALGGLKVEGYHIANLVIHCLAALLLFGIVRRTLLLPAMRERWGKAATALALVVGLLWTVHPLQTESVAYIVQRAESLMTLFYLLTLYCVIRGDAAEKTIAAVPAAAKPQIVPAAKLHILPATAKLWYAAAWLACLLGMLTKEVMVTAPMVVLLYDYTFLSSSFRKAIRGRWWLYAGMAATWLPLAYLVKTTALLSDESGLGRPDVWAYALSQPGVILHYLSLCFWPNPLCLDYSWPAVNINSIQDIVQEVLPGAIILTLAAAFTLWGLILHRAWGFLGACFFLILAPSSSVVNLADLAFEHRMYLPLAAVIALVITGGFWGAMLLERKAPASRQLALAFGIGVLAIACVILATLSHRRNEVYRTARGLWADTVEKRPNNPRALSNFGTFLVEENKINEANKLYERALQLAPNYAGAQSNYGEALRRQGRIEEAIQHLTTALGIEPKSADAHNNLGMAYRSQQRIDEAKEQFQLALECNPYNAEAYNNLGLCLGDKGKTDEEIAQYLKALQLNPNLRDARRNLAITYDQQGRTADSIEQFRILLQLEPNNLQVLNHVARLLATSANASIRDGQEAVRWATLANQLTGGKNPEQLLILADAHAEAGQFVEAVRTAQAALELTNIPDDRRVIEARVQLYTSQRAYNLPPKQPASGTNHP